MRGRILMFVLGLAIGAGAVALMWKSHVDRLKAHPAYERLVGP